MSSTLFSQGLLDAPVGLGMAVLVGFLFGLFLEQAGFGSSRKLTAVFYFRDMSVVKVMFTAVITALVGYHYLVAAGLLAPGDVHALDTYWGAQAVGGLLFGIGFVVGGWCPGTAFVGVASARWDALVFLVGSILGAVGFSELYRRVEPLYTGHCAGPVRLHETLGLPERLVVFGFCVAAVVVFAACTWVETAVGGRPAGAETARRNHRLAAGFLVLAGFGLVLAPTRPAGGAAGRSGPAQGEGASGDPVLAEVVAALDHVDPRLPEEHARFHLPGSLNIPLERLAVEAPLRIPRTGAVVLCTNGSVHAAQAWMHLRREGWTNVRVLTGGLIEFWREVLTPPSLVGPIDERSADVRRARWLEARERFLRSPVRAPGDPPLLERSPARPSLR